MNEPVTKGEFQEFKSEMLSFRDEAVTILRRLDEERVFSSAWVDRMEKELASQKQEVQKVKDHLHIK